MWNIVFCYAFLYFSAHDLKKKQLKSHPCSSFAWRRHWGRKELFLCKKQANIITSHYGQLPRCSQGIIKGNATYVFVTQHAHLSTAFICIVFNNYYSLYLYNAKLPAVSLILGSIVLAET